MIEKMTSKWLSLATTSILGQAPSRTPYGRFDVVLTTPAPTFPPMCLWRIGLCALAQRQLDALATNGGETCGSEVPR